jgi:hypothetical protein
MPNLGAFTIYLNCNTFHNILIEGKIVDTNVDAYY